MYSVREEITPLVEAKCAEVDAAQDRVDDAQEKVAAAEDALEDCQSSGEG